MLPTRKFGIRLRLTSDTVFRPQLVDRRKTMRYLLVPAFGFLVACASVALSQERQVNPLLTKDGTLTQELVVHEFEGGGLAAKSRRWTVKPDGAWELAVRDIGVVETKGKLSKDQLKELADDLAQYGLATLPSLRPQQAP